MVAFFTSGAYPRPHLELIYSAAGSALRAGHRVVVFAGTDKKRIEDLGAHLARHGVVRPMNPSRRGASPLGEGGGPACLLVCSDSRQQETANTALLFSRLDVMVAAAHERTNWAAGLGLPMFALLPNIGPFARQNYRFAVDQGVCLPLAAGRDMTRFGPANRDRVPGRETDPPCPRSGDFGSWLTELHQSGRLARMARAGHGSFPIGGAAVAASALLAGCS